MLYFTQNVHGTLNSAGTFRYIVIEYPMSRTSMSDSIHTNILTAQHADVFFCASMTDMNVILEREILYYFANN